MLKSNWKLYRRITQVCMLFVFLLPLVGCFHVIGTLSSSRILGITLTDPLAFLEVLVASKTVTLGFLVSALLIAIAYLILGKVFCSWVCPVGFLIEGVDALLDALKAKWKCEQKQYYWALPFFLLLSFVAGIPVFQTLSPLGIVYRTLLFGLGLEVLVIVIIIALELVGFRRGWCRLVCPIGAFYALAARWSPIMLRCDIEKCIQCHKCAKACAYTAANLVKMITERDGCFASALCTRCGSCIDVCPTGALQFSLKLNAAPIGKGSTIESGEVAVTSEKGITRRSALQGAGLLALTGLVYKPSQVIAAATPKVFRPPGAVGEGEFLAKCLRCGKCIEICPDKTLLSAHLDQGLNLGTPYFIPREVPCSLCMECPEVCPSGTLVPLDMREVRIGVAEIDKDLCYAYQDDVCRTCYNNCPLFDEAIKMEGFQYPVVDPEICTGCGICEYVCIMEVPAIRIKLIQ